MDNHDQQVLSVAADLAKPFEGLRLKPYHDPVGYPTVGYGHLLSRKRWEPLAKYPTLSWSEAEHLLKQDMLKALAAVRRLITAPLTIYQEAALTDFAFNCGSGNLQASTLRRVINRGEYDAAPQQFLRWVYAAGVWLPGLHRRRQAEVEIWET